MSNLVPAVFMSSPVSFILAGVLFRVGAPAGLALLASFAGCTLVAWALLQRA